MRRLLPLLFALTALAGCGGGGGSAPGLPLTNVGPFTTRGNVTGTPITIATSTVQGTAVTGLFSEVNLHDDNAGAAEKTPIYYSLFARGIFSANSDGTREQLIVPGYAITNLAISYAGTKLYYLDASSLYSVSAKGGPSTLFMAGVVGFSLSPSNKTIAYTKNVGGVIKLYVANINKTGEVLLASGLSSLQIAYMNESMVMFSKPDGMYRINIDGTQPTVIYDSALPRSWMRVSSDGRYAAWIEYNGASGQSFGKVAAVTNYSGVVSVATMDFGKNAFSVSFSQDSQYLLVSSQTAIYRVSVRYPSSGNLLIGGETSSNPYDAIYGRNPTDRSLVGTTGSFGTQLSAMIYSLRSIGGPSVAGFVGFDAVTPGSVVTTAGDNGVGQPFLNFVVEADQFTKLSYAVGLGWDVVSGLKTGSTANGAVVTLDGTTGALASVVTYNVARGGKPTIRQEGGSVTIRGNLLQTLDRFGHDGGPCSTVVVK
jgi:hypothetical protein